MARDYYDKQDWENKPARTTPVSARRMKHVEDGLEKVADGRALKEIYDDTSVNLGRDPESDAGEYSSTMGLGLVAASDCQHVQGKYNKADAAGRYAHIVGGGSSDGSRRNIHTLDWKGNAYYTGDVTNGQGVSLNSLNYRLDKVMELCQSGIQPDGRARALELADDETVAVPLEFINMDDVTGTT